MNIIDWFEDALPIKRKSTADWAMPALLGIAAGVAVGAGLALLYAPSTGEEARHKLREGAARAREKAGALAERAKDRLSPASNAVNRQIDRSS